MDISGVDLSLHSAILGAVQGQIGGILHKFLDYKYKIKHLKTSAVLQDLDNARHINIKSFSITRRILAIMVVGTVCFLPFAGHFTGENTFVFYSQPTGLLSSLFYGDEIVKLTEAKGIVIYPILSYMAGLIVTLYFSFKTI